MIFNRVKPANDWQRQIEEARLEVERLIALEREQMRQARELEKLKNEQARQARVQTRQAETLAKHERRISDLEFRVSQAEADIAHWKSQIGNYTALLDLELEAQAKTEPGSKADIQHQKRIITLSNQIHAAETRLAKAKHTKTTAEKELAA